MVPIMENVFKDKINPSNCFLKNDNFSVKTTNYILQSSRGKGVVSPLHPNVFCRCAFFLEEPLKCPF